MPTPGVLRIQGDHGRWWTFHHRHYRGGLKEQVQVQRLPVLLIFRHELAK